jgi:hypothetical protein
MTAYCFLTTSRENLTLLYTFTFSYSMLSVMSYRHIYKCVQVPLYYDEH